MGPWDGERAALAPTSDTDAGRPTGPGGSTAVQAGSTLDDDGLRLATWKQMIDLGSLQDNEQYLRATARPPVARLSRTVYDTVGPVVTVTGDRGSVTLPAEVADIVDGVVWVPANSVGPGVLAGLASPGSTVSVKGAGQ